MTNKFKSAVLAATAVLALGLSATSASAQTTAQGDATANIVGALDIVEALGASLNFGTIVPGTGGTVVITTAGVRTCNGGTTCFGAFDLEEFNVTGTAGQTVLVTHPASIQLSNGVPADDMSLSLVDNAVGVGNSFVMPVGGYTLLFGGTLTVASAQTAGVYTGTFDVDVAYQ